MSDPDLREMLKECARLLGTIRFLGELRGSLSSPEKELLHTLHRQVIEAKRLATPTLGEVGGYHQV